MQDYMIQTILSDTELLELPPYADRDPATWFFAAHSLGVGPVPADPIKPWVAWNELPATVNRVVRRTSNSKIRSFQFFVYDEAADFTIINMTLAVLERIVKEMAPFTSPDGVRCSDSEWFGISGNLPADAYDGIVRFGTARFVVSQ